jgi:hypothetical protein
MFSREALACFLPKLTVGGSSLSPEMMLVAVRLGLRCVEIPVHYGSRTGESKITGSFKKAFLLGLRMIAMIIAYRFRPISLDPETTRVSTARAGH